LLRDRIVDPHRSTLEAIQAEFEAARIEFFEDGGVRLRKEKSRIMRL
jgi:hypothetical protein